MIYQTVALLSLTAVVAARGAQTLPPTSAPHATNSPRPKFTSKIHIPVKLAGEKTLLPPPGYQLVFSDEFNATKLDQSKWGYRVDHKRDSAQRPENISLRDGSLRIALKKEALAGKAFTGGGVISRPTFVYAYFEARLKTPPAEGWHTSFWAMFYPHPDDNVTPRPRFLELDFCEQDGGDPRLFSFGIINQRPDPAKGETWNAGRWVIEDAPDMSEDFHVLACEFTPDKVRFYFDGRLAKEVGAGGFPHDVLNVWLTSIAAKMKGDRFIDESRLPAEAVCDYVRVYQNPEYRAAEEAVRAKVAERIKNQSPTKPAASGLPNDLN